jgi:coenzyme F420-reducing hydrogenase delta subunit
MPKIVTLICERSCDLSKHLDSGSVVKGMPGCYVVKFPCSGMIQPLMIEAALANGADGVVVTGCKIGDCYFREGNKMIRDRLLGERPPGLKKTVDRRRVIGLWLSAVQTKRFLSELDEFSRELTRLPAAETKPEVKVMKSAPPESSPEKTGLEEKPAPAGKPAPDKQPVQEEPVLAEKPVSAEKPAAKETTTAEKKSAAEEKSSPEAKPSQEES